MMRPVHRSARSGWRLRMHQQCRWTTTDTRRVETRDIARVYTYAIVFAYPSLCPSSFTRELSSGSPLCTNLRDNWFMIEPRIQTRPIYILMCRRSQFTTDRECRSIMSVRRCCDEIHRNRATNGVLFAIDSFHLCDEQPTKFSTELSAGQFRRIYFPTNRYIVYRIDRNFIQRISLHVSIS